MVDLVIVGLLERCYGEAFLVLYSWNFWLDEWLIGKPMVICIRIIFIGILGTFLILLHVDLQFFCVGVGVIFHYLSAISVHHLYGYFSVTQFTQFHGFFQQTLFTFKVRSFNLGSGLSISFCHLFSIKLLFLSKKCLYKNKKYRSIIN